MRGEIAKPCLLNALFENRIRGKAFGFQPLPNLKRLRTLLAATLEIPACGPRTLGIYFGSHTELKIAIRDLVCFIETH
jgi:hypothetical protein